MSMIRQDPTTMMPEVSAARMREVMRQTDARDP